jgi:hypothetical protein
MPSYLYYPLTTEINELKIAKIGKFDPDCKSEINKWDIDMDFKRTLQWYWFKSEVCVGPTLYSVKQIVAREKEMGNLRKSVDGLLSIGSGPNGDDLLVDAKTLGVYFWNHELARNHKRRTIFDCAKLYDHVVSLLLHIRNRDFIPWDAFQARDYYEMFKGV